MITADVNAHITDLICDVQMVNGAATAHISFTNLAYGTISAIKFTAVGYNSFGDVVAVNGRDRFILIIQDVVIDKNAKTQGLTAKLPNADIRRLELVENQICYADGQVLTYEGKKEITIEAEAFDPTDHAQYEQQQALKDEFGTEFTYKPQEIESGWLCGCGNLNTSGNCVCLACSAPRDAVFQAFTQEKLTAAVEKWRENNEKRREVAQKEEERQAKQRRKRNIMIGIGVIAAIILIYLICRAAVLSGRTTYDSAAEMRDALQGTYTYYVGGEASRQLKINGDKVSIIWRYTEPLDSEVRSWNYKNGTFQTFKTYTVTDKGDIRDADGDLYEKGGYMSTSSVSSSSTNYESGYSVLKFTDLVITSNSSYTICTGKVKNTGKKTYKFVEVKGSFQDSSGNVLDTDWTYAVGSEGLAPGESSEFRLSVTKDYNIEDCSVRILDFN